MKNSATRIEIAELVPETPYEFVTPHWDYQQTYDAVIAEVVKIQPACTLEIGCGSGLLSSMIKKQTGGKVIGLERSTNALQIARKHFPECDFQHSPGYEDYLQRFGKQDCIVSVEVIEHLTHPQHFLNLISACLTPGGSLILTTPYHGFLKNLGLSLLNRWDFHFAVQIEGGHAKFFSKKSLSALMERAGLIDVQIRGLGRCPGLYKNMIATARKPKT